MLLPRTTLKTAVPWSSFAPEPPAPLYVVITNVSEPIAAFTTNVQTVPLGPMWQAAELGVVLKTCAAPLLTTTPIDCVSDEIVAGCSPSERPCR